MFENIFTLQWPVEVKLCHIGNRCLFFILHSYLHDGLIGEYYQALPFFIQEECTSPLAFQGNKQLGFLFHEILHPEIVTIFSLAQVIHLFAIGGNNRISDK